MRHVLDHRTGLSDRARWFLRLLGARVDVWTCEQHREHWTRPRRPEASVEQLLAFRSQWAALLVPAAAWHEGGAGVFDGDDPEPADDGLTFSPGYPHCLVPHGYAVNGQGRFGICGDRQWAPMHGSIEGCVESIALTYHAMGEARTIRSLSNDVADGLLEEPDGAADIPEIDEIADNWYQWDSRLVKTYCGEALCCGGRSRPRVVAYEDAIVEITHVGECNG